MCCNLVYYPDENQTECRIFGFCIKPCPYYSAPSISDDEFESACKEHNESVPNPISHYSLEDDDELPF